MSEKKLKLTYFDFLGGRGEPARLAFVMGGIEFVDHRVPASEWGTLREAAPFHACPFLEVDGEVIAQSNTITRYAGRLTGLYPDDIWQAALCDEVLDAVEDMWVKLGATMGIQDPKALKQARGELAEKVYPRYLIELEKRLVKAGGKYFSDGRLTVGDLQVFVICRALESGYFEHIPKDLVETVAPQLKSHMQRVLNTPAISAYYEKMLASLSS